MGKPTSQGGGGFKYPPTLTLPRQGGGENIFLTWVGGENIIFAGGGENIIHPCFLANKGRRGCCISMGGTGAGGGGSIFPPGRSPGMSPERLKVGWHYHFYFCFFCFC